MKIKNFELVDRCLYWKEKGVFVVGDLHLGYEDVLNRQGVAIPRTQLDETLKILKDLLDCVIKKRKDKLKKIVLLGDVKHHFYGVLKDEFEDFFRVVELLERYCKKILIVKGNHDKILNVVVGNYDDVDLVDYFVLGGVCFLHGDKFSFEKIGKEVCKEKIDLVVVGHFHPAINFKEKGKSENYKCFLFGKDGKLKKDFLIVPSFFPLIEGSDILIYKEFERFSNFNVYVIADKVYDFGKLKKLG